MIIFRFFSCKGNKLSSHRNADKSMIRWLDSCYLSGWLTSGIAQASLTSVSLDGYLASLDDVNALLALAHALACQIVDVAD